MNWRVFLLGLSDSMSRAHELRFGGKTPASSRYEFEIISKTFSHNTIMFGGAARKKSESCTMQYALAHGVRG